MPLKQTALSLALLAVMSGCTPSGDEHTSIEKTLPSSSAQTNTLSDSERCTALAGKTFGDAHILQASAQVAFEPVIGTKIQPVMGAPGTGDPASGLSAFCRVVGDITPTPGSSIRFEVWLPQSQDWDGRLYGAGNGGFAGTIHYQELANSIKAGQAVVSTNTGHDGHASDASWAEGHPERVVDFAYRGIHLANVAAKTIIADYYGRPQDYAYFVSCSNGGRQALMEASRYPDDYDGIIAGAPAARWTSLIMSMVQHVQAQLPEGANLKGEQAVLLQQEVVKQCDASDALVDGLVSDPQNCQFNYQALSCDTNKSPLCFSEPQIGALKKIVEGPPKDADGNTTGYGFVLNGAEMGPMPYLGWDGWIFGRDPMPPSGAAFPSQSFKYMLNEQVDVANFDFNKHPKLIREQLGDLLDAKPDLSAFFNRGGKLILWHGWADAAIPPQLTLDFYHDIVDTSGERTQESLQFYMIPGVQHCFAGTGPGSFGQEGSPLPGDTPQNDMVSALQHWVEKGKKPGALIGKVQTVADIMGSADNNAPAKEKLICAYPKKAVLNDGANPDKADSYICQ